MEEATESFQNFENFHCMQSHTSEANQTQRIQWPLLFSRLKSESYSVPPMLVSTIFCSEAKTDVTLPGLKQLTCIHLGLS